jgi:hypothetical protein
LLSIDGAWRPSNHLVAPGLRILALRRSRLRTVFADRSAGQRKCELYDDAVAGRGAQPDDDVPGDTNYLPSTQLATGTVVGVGQLLFSLTESGPADLTVAPGGVASYSFTLSPNFGSYPGPVSFLVKGLLLGRRRRSRRWRPMRASRW